MAEVIETTVDSVIDAWTSERNQMLETNPEAVQFSMHLTNTILNVLTKGKPVTAEAVAHQAELSLADVEEAFGLINKQGGEFDDTGNLVGLALTLNPTPHRFRVNGHDLFTWCSLDTMFMPGLLGITAEVESTCPVTNQPIRLTITPDGVVDYSPSTTVLSITVPGVSCRRDDDAPEKPKTGPSSDGCSQMHFFSSPEAAEEWLSGRSGIAIFTVEDAYRLASINWIERRNEIISTPSTSSDGAKGCCC